LLLLEVLVVELDTQCISLLNKECSGREILAVQVKIVVLALEEAEQEE
jgi:hypothetical protein